MDDWIVRSHIEQLRYVPKKTSHLEITLHTVSLTQGAHNASFDTDCHNLQDSKYETNVEEPLAEDEISDCLKGKVNQTLLLYQFRIPILKSGSICF